ELEIFTGFIRPEGRRDGPVGTEQDHQALPRTDRTGQAETRQSNQKRQRCRREAHLLDKLPAIDGVHLLILCPPARCGNTRLRMGALGYCPERGLSSPQQPPKAGRLREILCQAHRLDIAADWKVRAPWPFV